MWVKSSDFFFFLHRVKYKPYICIMLWMKCRFNACDSFATWRRFWGSTLCSLTDCSHLQHAARGRTLFSPRKRPTEERYVFSYVGNLGKVARFVASLFWWQRSLSGVEKLPDFATKLPSWQHWPTRSSVIHLTWYWLSLIHSPTLTP